MQIAPHPKHPTSSAPEPRGMIDVAAPQADIARHAIVQLAQLTDRAAPGELGDERAGERRHSLCDEPAGIDQR
jgi:hypothetical protein